MSYQFDDFAVDPVAFRLTRSGQPVAIEPKALRVLIELIEHHDRPLTKQELLDSVWADVSVTENALTRAIAQLRKTLGDHADAPRYVETVPTRGYRFIADLRRADTAAPPPVKAQRLSSVPFVIVAVVAVLFLLGSTIIKSALHIGILTGSVARPIAARPFHSAQRLEVSPSFSPDGSSIVYCAEVDGTLHLFIAPLDGSSERQLTNGDGEAQPSWSPDGKQIAYVSVRSGGIFAVDANGGTPAQLTRFGSRPSWSPDGSEIAFESADDIEYGWNAYDALPPSTIWIVDVATKKATPLTTAGHPAGGHGAPAWQRDGARLAFSSCDNERCGIYTIARDSSGLVQLATDSRRLSSPLFSPNGQTVYFVLSLYDQSLLLAIDIDENGGPRGGSRVLRESNPGVMQHLAISLDGRRFAWSIVEEKNEIFAIGTGAVAPPTQLTSSATVSATFPSFSPDSQKIAYSAVAAGNESGVWVANADGSNARAITVAPGLKQYVRWSKRDWNIFYSAWDQSQHRPVLFRVSPNGGAPEPAAALPGDASAPSIASDLGVVAFNRTREGMTSVWESALDGSSLRQLTEEADLARFPVWSPSGRRLAVQLRGDGSSIAIFPGRKVIVHGGGENWPYSWSPDEREIAFAGRRDGVWNVWTVNVDSGATRKLTDFASTLTWVRTPAFSPDGKRIAFELGSPRAKLWISELKNSAISP